VSPASVGIEPGRTPDIISPIAIASAQPAIAATFQSVLMRMIPGRADVEAVVTARGCERVMGRNRAHQAARWPKRPSRRSRRSSSPRCRRQRTVPPGVLVRAAISAGASPS